MVSRIVIIGTSAAAIGALTRLRQLMPQMLLIVLSQEKERAYNKCLLADYAMGAKQEEELYTAARFENDPLVDIRYGTRVHRIMPEESSVLLADMSVISYDRLLIATGSSPAIPFIFKDCKAKNLFFFHTLEDVNNILRYSTENVCQSAVVIGAGLSGLECADALHKRGIKVTLIERQSQVLPSLITKEGAAFIEQRMRTLGIDVKMDTTIAHFDTQEGSITAVYSSDEQQFSADMIILATGSIANSALAREAGIDCNQWGILVNDHLQTSVPTIYAAGDVIITKNQLTGQAIRSVTWPDAMMQGGYAAFAMAGQPRVYPGVVPILSSSFFGLSCAIGGQLPESGASTAQNGGAYTCYTLDENRCLKGFIALGEQITWTHAKRALVTKEPFFFAGELKAGQ